MDVRRFHVEGYRSLLDVDLEFGQVTVLVGPNGSGKSNVYKALRLMHAAAVGQLGRTVVREGGMPSLVYAGFRRGEPRVEMTLGLDGMDYGIRLATVGRGAPVSSVAFPLDPAVTAEHIVIPGVGRPVELLDRSGSMAMVRDDDGRPVTLTEAFTSSESVLSQLRDDRRFPELHYVRHVLASMRFHDHLRTDEAAPARALSLGTRTVSVADDGADLAAALMTIHDEGERGVLADVVSESLDAALDLDIDEAGHATVSLVRDDIILRLNGSELSDGQVRFLFLAAALLSPRPPTMIVVNEPETSLHSELLAGVAAMIETAARSTQVVVTTHSAELDERLSRIDGTVRHELHVREGSTRVD